MDYFKNLFFTLDRFHVARDLKFIFKEHPRYQSVRIKLAKYNVEGLMTELNSAVGTMTIRIEKSSGKNPPKFYKERLISSVGEAVRNNVSILFTSSDWKANLSGINRTSRHLIL